MDHEFVLVDGVNINATHLLGLDQEQALKELLANDQVPGKNDEEKKGWATKALAFSKTALTQREEDRKKKAEDEVKRLEIVNKQNSPAQPTNVAAPASAATGTNATGGAQPAK